MHVHDLFERQVDRSPDGVAVVCADRQLSYGELNRRANQLAHYLVERAVVPEGRVGICTDRSLEMMVSILAVLKAGAAYVPLDRTYPEERLNYLLEDAEVRIVLTRQKPEPGTAEGLAEWI